MALPPAPPHRSKRGFEASALYQANFPDQRVNRIPGYSGHIPGVRVEAIGIGASTGKTSHNSMTVGNTTLPMTSTQPDMTRYYDRINTDAVLRRKESKHTLGHTSESDRYRANFRPGSNVTPAEAIYKADMVPGYTGFVPMTRDVTGATKAVTSKMGLAMHDREQERRHYYREKLLEDRNGRQRLHTTAAFQSNPAINYEKGPSTVPNTSSYSTELGIMKGCTKYVPQSKWSSIAQVQEKWTRDASALVADMRSSNYTTPTVPAFAPKPKGQPWKLDSSTVYVGVPGWKR